MQRAGVAQCEFVARRAGNIGRIESRRHGNGAAAEDFYPEEIGKGACELELLAEPVFIPDGNRIAELVVQAAENRRRIVQRITVRAVAAADSIYGIFVILAADG